VTEYLEVPDSVLRRLRVACSHLPEANEENSYAGVRWRIRGRTVVEVVTTERDQSPVTFITFHAAGEDLNAMLGTGDPFAPGWGPGLVAMTIDAGGATDWDEVQEMITESYCLLAPQKLVALLNDSRHDSR
jgi:hypothetical protein